MRKRNIVLTFVFITSIISCSIFELGYTDEYNRYVPKKPNYSLKDKSGHVHPAKLDTVNIYKLHYEYYRGKETYPNNSYATSNSSCELCKRNLYLKFFKNGRSVSFATPNKDEFNNPYILKNNDLNYKEKHYNIEYYYSKGDNSFKIESFVYATGYGMYLIFDYTLNKTGDTITRVYDKHSVSIYVKEKVPENWKNILWNKIIYKQK